MSRTQHTQRVRARGFPILAAHSHQHFAGTLGT
jgi:hypothetical protein